MADPSKGLVRLLLRAALAAALGWALPAYAPPPAAAQLSSTDSLTVTLAPRDIWPPSSVTDLTALAGAEGQILLQWTAPDANDYALGFRSSATAYNIRVATFSVASVGGSTLTWWNLANDIQALPLPAVSVTPPTPGMPGTAESQLLSRLEPGVTYFAMVQSVDNVGLQSNGDTQANGGTQAQGLVFDARPPTPPDLAVLQTGKSTFTVTFTSVSVYDLDFYRLYIDSTTPYDFANAFTVTRDTPTATATITLVVGGLSTGTYHFRLVSVDKGTPSYAGWALESSTSATVIIDLVPLVLRPQSPFGVKLTTAGFTTTLRWMPVTRYANGIGFADPNNPTVDELTGYQVLRATTPVKAVWENPEIPGDLAGKVLVGTTTLSYTDLGSGAQYYYRVKAFNDTGSSRGSVVRAAGSQSAWVVAPDDQSALEILSGSVAPIEGVHPAAGAPDPMTAYLVEASSRPQDIGGRVLRSIDFGAWQGGLLPMTNMTLSGMGWLRMHYDLGASGSVTAQGFEPLAGVANTPENMSVYWYNGARWVQLYGKLDKAAQQLLIETLYTGTYQLRSVERPLAFNFNQAGVSNRLVTPNGDGKNDTVVFTYDNPRDSEVVVRLLDMRGKQVVGSLPAGPVSNSKQWDGTAGGRAVPGGVYIYQIEGEGKTFTGTIVIIR